MRVRKIFEQDTRVEVAVNIDKGRRIGLANIDRAYWMGEHHALSRRVLTCQYQHFAEIHHIFPV
jgi:hypothetical protein